MNVVDGADVGARVVAVHRRANPWWWRLPYDRVLMVAAVLLVALVLAAWGVA